MEDKIKAIIDKYDTNLLISSDVSIDGGVDPLWPRLNRAILNQCDRGEATIPRYAAWANTVRDNIAEAIIHLEDANQEQARYYLTRAANSLSAFVEAQELFEQDHADNS